MSQERFQQDIDKINEHLSMTINRPYYIVLGILRAILFLALIGFGIVYFFYPLDSSRLFHGATYPIFSALMSLGVLMIALRNYPVSKNVHDMKTIEEVLAPLSTSSYVYEIQVESPRFSRFPVNKLVVRRIGSMPV